VHQTLDTEENLQSMKKLRSLLLLLAAATTFFGGSLTWAQTSPTTDDLQKKFDDLENQLIDVRAQLDK
jgi:hypothetical protein